MIKLKRKLRIIRLERELNMNEAAATLGMSRKQLEDIETIRPYGAHVQFETALFIVGIYKASVADILALQTSITNIADFQRPREAARVD